MSASVHAASQTSLMARLRTETRPHHEAAEQHPLQRALAMGRLERSVYAAYLARLGEVHAALEGALTRGAALGGPLSRIVDPALFVSEHLAADLRYYGGAALAPDRSPSAPGFRQSLTSASPARLLGLWYVLEGSKNGGRFIAKGVRRGYGLTGQDGVRSLDPHGDDQPALWANFKSRVDAESWTEVEVGDALDGARAMFGLIMAVGDEALASAG